MPKGDSTGPLGQGSKTGRALGFCQGYNTLGYMNGFGNGMGRGSGFGRGIGRGWGYSNRFSPSGYSPITPWQWQILSKNDEIKMLKSQAETLSRAQKDIEKRLDELKK